MQYVNGVTTSLRYDQMSPLDRALEKYSHQAEKYYRDLNEAENSPPDVREKRKVALASAKAYLDHERGVMQNIGDVQAELEMYRERGKLANRKELLAEEHHPTGILEKYMRAVPVPKPSSNHTAHHISPGKGKTKFANRARVRMHLFKVRISDPDNGVWLPRYAKHTPHWSMPESKGHLQYHTEGYEKWASDKLQATSSELMVRQQLQLIGTALQQNNIPPEARSKKSQAQSK